jgi:hypothetical protein
MKYLLFYFTCLLYIKGVSQKNITPIYSKLNYHNFLLIEINGGIETFNRDELNVFYMLGNGIKVHSIIRTNRKNYELDTCYVLSSNQWDILNKFYKSVVNNFFERDSIIYAGSYTKINLTLDSLQYTVENKSQISLADKLLGRVRN